MTVKELALIFNQLALDEVNRHVISRSIYFKQDEIIFPILSVEQEKFLEQDIVILDWRKKLI